MSPTVSGIPAAPHAGAPPTVPASASPADAPATVAQAGGGAPAVPPLAGAAPARRSRGPLVPVLAGFTVLFFVLSVVFGVLFFVASTDLTASRSTVASQKEQLKEKDAKLVAVEGERDKARQELDTSKDSVSSLTADKTVIAQCLKGVLDMFKALADGNRAQFEAVTKRIEAPCTRAEGLIT